MVRCVKQIGMVKVIGCHFEVKAVISAYSNKLYLGLKDLIKEKNKTAAIPKTGHFDNIDLAVISNLLFCFA